MVGNASYSSFLSISSGMFPSSWLMDSTCCNHMTPHSSLFFQPEPAPHPLNIRTANGSTMFGHNIGSISTSNLSVPGVFNVPNFSYNLFSVGHNIETCYQHNKSVVSISAATITNTKSIQPIAPISAKSKSSRPIITISTVDL